MLYCARITIDLVNMGHGVTRSMVKFSKKCRYCARITIDLMTVWSNRSYARITIDLVDPFRRGVFIT